MLYKLTYGELKQAIIVFMELEKENESPIFLKGFMDLPKVLCFIIKDDWKHYDLMTRIVFILMYSSLLLCFY